MKRFNNNRGRGSRRQPPPQQRIGAEINFGSDEPDATSPIPSPYVGPQRRKRQEQRALDDDEDEALTGLPASARAFLVHGNEEHPQQQQQQAEAANVAESQIPAPPPPAAPPRQQQGTGGGGGGGGGCGGGGGGTGDRGTNSRGGGLTSILLRGGVGPQQSQTAGRRKNRRHNRSASEPVVPRFEQSVEFDLPAANERTNLMAQQQHRSCSDLSLDDDDDDDGDDDDDDDNNTEYAIFSVFEAFEDNAKEVIENIQEATTEAFAEFEEHRHYDWREFWKGGNVWRFVRWLATGIAVGARQSDEEIQDNLDSLARMLHLLREYYDRFGMPEQGGPKDQEYVLREVAKDLYAGGSPIWALEPVMKKVAEGLTGKRGVDFFMLPRRCFIFAPSSGATSMFHFNRGYDMQKLDGMEAIAVRLASFASNTSSVASMPARWPKPQELRRAYRTESLAGSNTYDDKEDLAEEILTLASEAEGLFFFINSERQATARDSPMLSPMDKTSELGEFWTVEDNLRELFSRLAVLEAATAIDKMDAERKPLYSNATIVFFRLGSSAGACAFWFNGSWGDILVSGLLAVLVAEIGNWPVLSKQERIIFEAVASFVVGLVSGVVALQWPAHFCFGAMAISGVLDLLQGFRVVYSIIEIMSRHTVTGGADFLEGVFFTTLIAYFLRFGQYVALQIMGTPEDEEYTKCDRGVSEWWYFLFVPLGALCWSGLFNPHYIDLPFMVAHGVLGYLVSWQFYKATSGTNTNLNNFVAAMAVTFSAGVLSRFTGRGALANTVAGIYVLLPGAYLVSQVYNDRIEGFLTQIILRAVIIGIGAWTGTILCTPTLLGINRGLMNHSNGMPTLISGNNESTDQSVGGGSTGSNMSGVNFRRRKNRGRATGTGAILFF